MDNIEFAAGMRRLGLRDHELARILHVSPQTVRRWIAPDGAATARGVNPTAAAVLRWMRDHGWRPPEWPDRLAGR